ncbi:Gfo/Idh/MocA family protein [Haloprofundus salinisoli]|uniref:Gfo/Idh/MocA family protein n=1 Tax=Haloprofundus salinisoli TaxID=2876193 RepID=UPI001CCF9CC7|nr:Gfo/Idh/MocA family oxidoreductase [Haloprofundus salinisoli]
MNVVGIGLGDLGRLELRTLAALDGVNLVAGADVSPDAREAFAEEHDVPTYESYEELLDAEDADAACIVTPHTLHYEQARACLDRGVHVHLEKPMVTDLGHARDLRKRADEADLTLAVGYQRHVDWRFRKIRRLIDEGAIGELHMAVCFLEQVWISVAEGQWRGNPALSGGGQLYDSGSHLLDALLWTTRTDPVSVAAAVDDRGHDVDVNSALAVTLDRDGDRVSASVGVSGAGRSAPAPGEGLHLWGTEGRISLADDTLTVESGGEVEAEDAREPGFEELTETKLQNFVDAVRGDAELAIPATDAIRVTALTEAAYEAAETERTVAIDAFGEGEAASLDAATEAADAVEPEGDD